MFDSASSSNIWVAQTNNAKEDGSKEAPFSSIKSAVEAAMPGSTVVISQGEYDESVSINERAGEETSPITIMADPAAESVILKGEWYLYEVSDFIITGLTFVDTENTALSLVGASKRNIFKECLFINCGESAECTLFLGGSNGEFNVIENCQFTRNGEGENRAILVAQSKDEEDASSVISTNTIVRFCTFENYTTALLLGSGDEITDSGNHLVKENLFHSCGEGIRIKAVATDIRENIFKDCKISINQVGGQECEIVDNRIESSETGIRLTCSDTTVSDNCCIDAPVEITLEPETILPTVINNNSFIFTDHSPALTVKGKGTDFSVIVSDNLLYNSSVKESSEVRLHENHIFPEGGVKFQDMSSGDFRCDSISAGCKSGAAFRTKIAPLPQVDLKSHGITHEAGESAPAMDERDLYLRSLFMINEDDLDEFPGHQEEDDEDERPEDNEFYDFED